MEIGAARRRYWPRAVLAALGAALLCAWRLLVGDPFTQSIEHATLDWRFQLRGAVAAPPEILIVHVDNRTLERFGAKSSLRGALAETVCRLDAGGARAVAIDFILDAETAGDNALAAAMVESGATALAVAAIAGTAPPKPTPEMRAALGRSAFRIVLHPDGGGDASGRAPMPALLAPTDQLAGASALGHANISAGPDRAARLAPVYMPLGDVGYLPALSLQAARIARGLRPDAMSLALGDAVTLGASRIPVDAGGDLALNHYGSDAFHRISLVDLLDRPETPGAFEGRVAFIGATAESFGDMLGTPYGLVPGVEILTTFYGNLAERSWLRRDAVAVLATLGLALALSALAVLAATALPPGASLVACAGLGALAGVALLFAFETSRLWLDATTVLGAPLLAAGACGLERALMARRDSARLGRVVSPLTHFLLSEPGRTHRTEQAVAMFVDAAGSTARAEAEAPEAVAAMLSALHDRIALCAAEHGGSVVEVLGDGALVVFGFVTAPEVSARAALAFAAELLDAPSESADRSALRVSGHLGPMTLAVVGGAVRSHVTVAGDTVNVAARLQDVARDHSVSLVVSRAVLDVAGEAAGEAAGDDSPWRRLEMAQLRGRQAAVEVWSNAVAGAGA